MFNYYNFLQIFCHLNKLVLLHILSSSVKRHRWKVLFSTNIMLLRWRRHFYKISTQFSVNYCLIKSQKYQFFIPITLSSFWTDQWLSIIILLHNELASCPTNSRCPYQRLFTATLQYFMTCDLDLYATKNSILLIFF